MSAANALRATGVACRGRTRVPVTGSRNARTVGSREDICRRVIRGRGSKGLNHAIWLMNTTTDCASSSLHKNDQMLCS